MVVVCGEKSCWIRFRSVVYPTICDHGIGSRLAVNPIGRFKKGGERKESDYHLTWRVDWDDTADVHVESR